MNQDFYDYHEGVKAFVFDSYVHSTYLHVHDNDFMNAKAFAGYISHDDDVFTSLLDVNPCDEDINGELCPLSNDLKINAFLSTLNSLDLSLRDEDLGTLILNALKQANFLSCTICLKGTTHFILKEDTSRLYEDEVYEDEDSFIDNAWVAGTLFRMTLERNEDFVIILF